MTFGYASQSGPPAICVTIEGAEIPAGAYEDLLDVKVVDDLAAPSMFTLRLLTWDEDELRFTWVDDALFAVGNDVEIALGYVGDVATVIAGEITSLSLEMAAGETPVLVVQGYDRRHRMTRGTSTRVFTGMKDSDIAAQIARAQKLTPAVTDSGAVHAYVAQVAQTDLDFLTERARGIDYEVVVEGTTFYFRPSPQNGAPRLSLSMSADVIEFSPRMSTRNQPGEIEIRSWDPKTKQPIVARSGSLALDAMGATTGPALADGAFGAAITSLVDQAVSTQQEADQRAAAALRERASTFIEGEGTCFGRYDLRAGIVVDVEGLGQRFSGVYDVVATTHSYSPKQGYRTRFSATRNAT